MSRRRRDTVGVMLGVVVLGAVLFLRLSAQRSSDRLSADRRTLVAIAKGRHLVDQRLSADYCVTIQGDRVWAEINHGVGPGGSAPKLLASCRPYDFTSMLVFHRVRGKWNFVTALKTWGHLGPCTIPGVPVPVTRSLPMC